MRFGFCLLWLQVILLLLTLTFIATADAQLPGNTTSNKKLQCLRVRKFTDWSGTVLSGKQPFHFCGGNGEPTWPTDLTKSFVHWECRPLKEAVLTVPQFVFKLIVTEGNSAENTTDMWEKLENYCGCKLTYYSLSYLSKEISSHNKWHFSSTTIPVGLSCGNRDTAQCRMTLL